MAATPGLLSCTACQSLYQGPICIQPRNCPSAEQLRYWHPHHREITSLCRSALIGCRLCADVWAYFFLEKSPEEYAERPYFMVGSTRHFYDGSGTSYRWKRYESRDGDNSLAHDTQGSWPLLGNRKMGASQAETSDSSTRASGKIEFSTQS